MTSEDVVKIYQAGGYNIRNRGNIFFLHQGLLNYSFPFLTDVKISGDLINFLKFRYPLSIIKTVSRYKNTYEFILYTDHYDLELFKRKVRNNIRKSIKECVFREPDLNEIIQQGLMINKLTLIKQKRKDRYLTDPKKWGRFIESFYQHRDFFILGAYKDERMIGYLMAYNMDGTFVLLNPYSDRRYSTSAPMNGLIYTFINNIIEKYGMVKVSYGIESFSPLPELDFFKENMLFRRIPVTRIYLINSFLLPLIKIIIFLFFKAIRRNRMKSVFFQKLVKLYQGHRKIRKICEEYE